MSGSAMDLPYVFRWNVAGRKGARCAVTARSKPMPGSTGLALAFGSPKPKRFNSICVRFADGFSIVTSGNAIKRAG